MSLKIKALEATAALVGPKAAALAAELLIDRTSSVVRVASDGRETKAMTIGGQHVRFVQTPDGTTIEGLEKTGMAD